MRLYYFTNSFPYGYGEQWKFQELEVLKEFFNEITVIPYSYGNNRDQPRQLSAGVKVTSPLFNSEPTGIDAKHALMTFLACPRVVVAEVFDKKLFKSKARLAKAVAFMSNASRIKRSAVFKKLYLDSTSDTCWFFYWGRGAADVVPFLGFRKWHSLNVRLHGYDLFEFRSEEYIPFRSAFYNRLEKLFSVSAFGLQYLTTKYPGTLPKAKISRLGTVSVGRSPLVEDGRLKIITCSAMLPVKRLTLFAKSLQFMGGLVVHWTHLGSGPVLGEIEREIKHLPSNISVALEGVVPAESVLNILTSRPFDIFVNVSESEGVPVSIMEALSAGIPVVATNAGGTGEIVDEHVGAVLPVDVTPEEVAKAIRTFHELPREIKTTYRDKAFQRYREVCDMRANVRKFAKELIKR